MIKRLQEELAKRKELQDRLFSILHRKQETEIELENRKRKLEDLKGQLQTLLKVHLFMYLYLISVFCVSCI